eukprot:8553346-Pyramimonas_sp.AAC.1
MHITFLQVHKLIAPIAKDIEEASFNRHAAALVPAVSGPGGPPSSGVGFRVPRNVVLPLDGLNTFDISPHGSAGRAAVG